MIDKIMKKSWYYFNENISSLRLLIVSLFFCFNFLDRNISNFFLIALLVLCIIDLSELRKRLQENKVIIYSVLLFTFWILLVSKYHESPIHELDNYMRFAFLLPLLLITYKDIDVFKIVLMTTLFSLLHFILSYIGIFDDVYFENRYMGTSSSAITYGNLLSIILLLPVYLLFKQKNNITNILIYILLICILASLWFITGTRGPIIGIAIALTYLSYIHRNYLLPLFIFLMLILLGSMNDSFTSRILEIKNIQLDTKQIIDTSNKERVTYFYFGLEKIKENPFLGIGPQNIETELKNSLDENSSVEPRDHLHNEFIDISAKFGLPALVLLIYVYISILKSSASNKKSIVMTLLILLFCSQLTQSQFAHHQITSFFIVAIYISINQNYRRREH